MLNYVDRVDGKELEEIIKKYTNKLTIGIFTGVYRHDSDIEIIIKNNEGNIYGNVHKVKILKEKFKYRYIVTTCKGKHYTSKDKKVFALNANTCDRHILSQMIYNLYPGYKIHNIRLMD